MSLHTPSMVSLDQALDHASRMLDQRPELALQQVDEILLVSPAHPEALLLRGRGLRLGGRWNEARATLEALAAEQPRSAATAFELGLVAYQLGDANAAIAALQRAVSLKPDLSEAWNALADVLRLTGDEAGADKAYRSGVCASPSDPLLMEAALALTDERLSVAETLLRSRLKQRPTDVAAIRMLAELAGRIGRYREACHLLERAVELAPGFVAARQNLALALHRRGRSAEALATISGLLAEEPANPSYLNLKAAILTRMGDYELAVPLYRTILARYPDQPKIWMSLGHVLKTIGEQAESIAAYRRAIAMRPSLGEAWWSLANLKTVSFSDRDRAVMRAALAAPDLDGEDRFHLEFALGKAEEDAGDVDASFAHYAAGNRGRRALLDYDADRFTAFIRRNETLYTREFFEARAGWGCQAGDPIFVVSLPRSGSTLIEQILASHSQVEGTAELQDIGSMLAGRSVTDIAGLGRAEVQALGEAYLAHTRVHRKTDRPFFVDKMPNNWAHVGFIRLILPQAKIVDARRHPLGCCFSNFKQHFARGQPFTYDLNEIGAYYRDYVTWMEHIDATLPGYVHRIFYEAMVDDTEGQARSLIDYIGLPFEDTCIRFYETRRAVATASSEQVRRPIFRDGLEQWKRFEGWLDPLKTALGPALDAYPFGA